MRSTKLMFMVSILVPATFFAVAALAIHAAGPTEKSAAPAKNYPQAVLASKPAGYSGSGRSERPERVR